MGCSPLPSLKPNYKKHKPFLEDITLQNELFRVQTGDSFQRILPFWIQETPALTMPCGVLSGGSAPFAPSRARNKAPPGRGKIHSLSGKLRDPLPAGTFEDDFSFSQGKICLFFFGGYVYFPIRMMEDLWNVRWLRNPANYAESMVLQGVAFFLSLGIYTPPTWIWCNPADFGT